MLKVINDSSLTDGTSLKDYIFGVTYYDLVNKFGEPNKLNDKVNFEWVFKFDDKVFTIYDWKTDYDYSLNNLTIWNVGGHYWAGDFIDAVEKLLKQDE